SALHKLMREFAREHGITLHDVGEGVCHQVIPESGRVGPGCLVVGADSHTCTYGALGCVATGVGSTDLAAAMITGSLWFKVPHTMKVVCRGQLPPGVYAKDLILHIVGDVGADGATYLAVEYTGEAVEDLSMDGRFTLCNMAVEMGAKTGIVAPDRRTLSWLERFAARSFETVHPDPDAEYAALREYDVSTLVPKVACPHRVDNVVPVDEVAGTKVQQAVLGTCTNGRLEDLRVAAGILRGRKVHPDTRLVVAPASRRILLEAMREGIIQDLVEAGAALVTPGCGPCVGTHNGIPADGERVVSTANRNFKGRMGNNKAEIYLASPATVAASAVAGEIADPREFLR
ncbi:MAG: 3-isopropylmalate dehydratase large subunit, partial [Firmicutes bacterium]|nr:3-isopropylmalate dehydratase large subunit [Bacillota bacterium]